MYALHYLTELARSEDPVQAPNLTLAAMIRAKEPRLDVKWKHWSSAHGFGWGRRLSIVVGEAYTIALDQWKTEYHRSRCAHIEHYGRRSFHFFPPPPTMRSTFLVLVDRQDPALFTALEVEMEVDSIEAAPTEPS